MPSQTRKQKRTPVPVASTVYHSTQYNSTIVNGRQVATEKTVDIKNGKGTMTVKKMANGRVLASTTRKLSPSQTRKIERNKFVPKLFHPCIRCNTRKMGKMGKMGKLINMNK